MLKELLTLLPDAVSRPSNTVALAAVGVGIGLWAVGGRFSRAVLTLTMVAVGALVGLRLPRWMGWSLDGAAVGVFGAMVLGCLGYFLHRAWVGALFGTVLALWAGAAVWIGLAPVVKWHLPVLHWRGDSAEFLSQIWQALPAEIQRATPIACGCGMLIGVLTTVLWPRLSRAALFSVLGVTLAVVMGGPVAARVHPEWLDRLPPGMAAQGLVLVVLVALGTLVQWCFMEDDRPRAKTATGAKSKRKPPRPGAAAKPDGNPAGKPDGKSGPTTTTAAAASNRAAARTEKVRPAARRPAAPAVAAAAIDVPDETGIELEWPPKGEPTPDGLPDPRPRKPGGAPVARSPPGGGVRATAT